MRDAAAPAEPLTPPPEAAPADLADWLRLLLTPGLGRIGARRLLAILGSPAALFQAERAALVELAGPALAGALAQRPEGLAALVGRTHAWLAAAPHHRVLVLGDADYPSRWLDLADPPLLVHASGRLDLLQRPAVAVVGTRHPTPQGLAHARRFATALAEAGVTVVSGLAQGIDGAAHEGALERVDPASGSSIAVVGTGLDRVYPRAHLALAHRLDQAGLLLSEFPLGTAPLAPHFPQRNRLIAAHGAGTLVVEAALQSGSLITARLALEIGREVFALPGDIDNPQARGCHELLRQGATLVETPAEVLAELHLGPPVPPPAPRRPRAGDRAAVSPGAVTAARSTAPPSPPARPVVIPAPSSPAAGEMDEDDPVLQALGWSPATLDVLQVRTGWSASALSVRLLELELDGQVVRQPGQVFSRIASA